MGIAAILNGVNQVSSDIRQVSGVFQSISNIFTGQGIGTFNINNFRSELDSLGGILRKNMFQVEVAMPSFLQSSSVDTRTLSFFCMATSLPGAKLATKSVQRYGYGPEEKMPMAFTFADVTLNFIADAEGVILNFFEDWIRGAIETSAENGPNSPPSTRRNQAASMLPYMVNYKKNYESTVSINLFDSTGINLVYNTNLDKAFPIEIGEIYLNWNNSEEFMIIPVTFSFLDKYSDIPSSSGGIFGAIENGISSIENFIGGIASTSTISTTIQSTTTQLQNIAIGL